MRTATEGSRTGTTGEGCDLGSDHQKMVDFGKRRENGHGKRAVLGRPFRVQHVRVHSFGTWFILVIHVGDGHTLCVYGTDQLSSWLSAT